MTRLSLLSLAAMVTSVAVAAPVPKAKDETVDLKKLHERIAEAVAKDNWSDDDTKMAEEKVKTLLARMTKTAEVEEWKLPVAFKGLDKKTAGDDKVTARKALVVGEKVNVEACSNCVIMTSGHVHATSLSNCIVVARTVYCTFADNSIVIAEEHACAASWGLPRLGGCVVVAGKRIRATGIEGGMFHVITPDFTCNVEEGKADSKDRRPVLMTVASKATFLVDPAAPAMGDKDCKRVELKASIAK